MVNRITAHNAVGIIGNVISFGLFLSPVPTFVRIIKNKDVEDFQPYPYVATVLNCMLWVFYGLPFITPNSILVVTINGVGLFIEAIYLIIFLAHCRDNKKRKNVVLLILAEMLLMAALVSFVMLAIKKPTLRGLVVGILCDIFNVIMYASPLLVARMVMKTKSVKYMPLYLSVANFANGLIWTTYSLIIFDRYILISNGLGAFFGAIQLILYGWISCLYPQSQTQQDATLKPSQIQIHSISADSEV